MKKFAFGTGQIKREWHYLWPPYYIAQFLQTHKATAIATATAKAEMDS